MYLVSIRCAVKYTLYKLNSHGNARTETAKPQARACGSPSDQDRAQDDGTLCSTNATWQGETEGTGGVFSQLKSDTDVHSALSGGRQLKMFTVPPSPKKVWNPCIRISVLVSSVCPHHAWIKSAIGFLQVYCLLLFLCGLSCAMPDVFRLYT